MVGLAKFDVSFSITITSHESVMVTKETIERVRKTLQDDLNEPKLLNKLKLRFGLSQISEAECQVDNLIVKPSQYPSL